MTAIQIAAIGFIGIGLVGGSITIIGASVYDLFLARRNKYLRMHPYLARPRRRALFSVIIPINENDSWRQVEASLLSITKSSVRKYELIIVNCSNSNNIQSDINSFISRHHKKAISVCTTSKPGYKEAVLSGLKKTKGELVIVLTPSYLVKKNTLEDIIMTSSLYPQTSALLINQQSINQHTLASLIKQYSDTVYSQLLKLEQFIIKRRVVNIRSVVLGRSFVARLIRDDSLALNEQFDLILTKSRHRPVYVSEAVVQTTAAYSLTGLMQRAAIRRISNFKQLSVYNLANKRSPFVVRLVKVTVDYLSELVRLSLPLMLGYFIFLAASQRTVYLFGLSWLIISIFLLLSVWGDEQLKTPGKIRLSLLIPITYFLVFIVSFFEFFVQLGLIMSAIKNLAYTFINAIRRLVPRPVRSGRPVS